MKLIANETEYARRCLDQGYIDKKKPYKSIRTIVRFLKNHCGIRELSGIANVINEYIEVVDKPIEINMDTIRTFYHEDTPYNELESISLSSKELYMIMNNNYPHSWRKILFVMLVHYKVKKAIYPDVDNNRIDSDLTSIMTDAHTTLGTEKRMQMLQQFEKDGYIEMPNGGSKAKYLFLNYIDEEPQDELIIVSDFFDFYLYFECYVKGGRLIYCQECGKLVLDKTVGAGRPVNYCKKCAKEKELNSKRGYWHKTKN